jgi:hypothetical protein
MSPLTIPISRFRCLNARRVAIYAGLLVVLSGIPLLQAHLGGQASLALQPEHFGFVDQRQLMIRPHVHKHASASTTSGAEPINTARSLFRLTEMERTS